MTCFFPVGLQFSIILQRNFATDIRWNAEASYQILYIWAVQKTVYIPRKTYKNCALIITLRSNMHAIIFNFWSCFFKTFVLAGLCSGLTEGVFINPFEVVKVKLQTEQQHFSEVWPSCYKYFVATSAVEHGTDLCMP